MASGPITSWQIEGEKWKQWQILFSWVQKPLWTVTAAMKLKDASSLEGKLWQPRQRIKNQRHDFANKAMVFPEVIYGFEIQTIKKIEGWRSDAFELWCW